MPSPYQESANFFKRAAIAGTLGGAVMAMVAVAFALARGTDVSLPLKMASSLFYLERALEPGFDAGPVAVGIVTHLGVSIAWATIFGFLAYRLSRAATLLVGPLCGLVAGAVTSFVAFPLLGLTRLRLDMPLGPSVVQYLVFGLFIALGFAYKKPPVLSAHEPQRVGA
jgi:hypothetical protein